MPKVVLHHIVRTKKALDAANLVNALYLAGHRVVAWLAEPGKAAVFDAYLWTFSQSSFVPHSLWDGSSQVDDPVVVVSGSIANVNGASHLVTVDRPLELKDVALFAEVHDLVTALPEDAGVRDAWLAAGFDVAEASDAPSQVDFED
jgi:DNA polymerase III subunit chi